MNFGPYSKWESISAFDSLSEKAFTSFDELVQQHWSLLSRPVHRLFLRVAYQAKTTSLAARLNNSWALCLPAFALTRVRLEQTIVCSYLLHEDESVGLRPFVAFIPIGNFKSTRVAMDDPLIAQHLPHVDLSVMEGEAVKAQKEFTPNFSAGSDKFERNGRNLTFAQWLRGATP